MTPFKTVTYSLLSQEVTLVKAGGPLGLSIVGGSDHASHPFGVREPGVFISKVSAENSCLLKSRRAARLSLCLSIDWSVCNYISVCLGHSSGPGLSEWAAGGRPHPGGELHRPAPCHAPRGGPRPALQQARDPDVSAPGPCAPGHGRESRPRHHHEWTASTQNNPYLRMLLLVPKPLL